MHEMLTRTFAYLPIHVFDISIATRYLQGYQNTGQVRDILFQVGTWNPYAPILWIVPICNKTVPQGHALVTDLRYLPSPCVFHTWPPGLYEIERGYYSQVLYSPLEYNDGIIAASSYK